MRPWATTIAQLAMIVAAIVMQKRALHAPLALLLTNSLKQSKSALLQQTVPLDITRMLIRTAGLVTHIAQIVMVGTNINALLVKKAISRHINELVVLIPALEVSMEII